MSKKHLKIMFLFDLLTRPPAEEGEYTDFLSSDDWEAEAKLIRTLKDLGHEVHPFALYNDIEPLCQRLIESPPDLVFNQCEALKKDRKHEPHIVSLLELFDIRYTGADPTALQICKDKGLTKKILSFHRIRVPNFTVSYRSRPLRRLGRFTFPALIKPLSLEASEGIAQLSFAEHEADALERIQFLHQNFDSDVIIEEYIEGREVYVGVMGNERLEVFPPRELFFREVPPGEPKIATYKAKWEEEYRKRWGIKTGLIRGLTQELEKKIHATCKKIYRLFLIKG